MHNSTFSSIEKCNSQDLVKARKAVNKYVKIKLLLTVGNLRRQAVYGLKSTTGHSLVSIKLSLGKIIKKDKWKRSFELIFKIVLSRLLI